MGLTCQSFTMVTATATDRLADAVGLSAQYHTPLRKGR